MDPCFFSAPENIFSKRLISMDKTIVFWGNNSEFECFNETERKELLKHNIDKTHYKASRVYGKDLGQHTRSSWHKIRKQQARWSHPHE